jgi:hypothetical protein
VDKKINQLISLFSEKLGIFLSISLGIFIFILFFQPFPLERFDFNNRLIFVSGLGGIVFFFMVLIRAVFTLVITKKYQNNDPLEFSYLSSFLILALSSVAFAFYLRFVGLIEITFYVIFKVVLICLVPPLALRLDDTIKDLRQKNKALLIEKKIIQKQVEKYEEDYLNKSIDFISENNTEILSLVIADVAFIKSADNYVEIVYQEGDYFKKKLIRNTLKNVELQIRQYSNFIRCHRICIVNLHFIEKLNTNYNSHWIAIKGYQEHIPVSRQYLLKLKELF